MTKKDYIIIAGVINYCKPSKIAKPKGYQDRMESWQGVIEVMGRELEKDNSKFNRQKFADACGLYK